MKKLRRLFAILLVISICMTIFVLPGHAITIYGDKGLMETYWDSQLCKRVKRRFVYDKVADDQWDDIGWKYKKGKATGEVSHIGGYPTRAGVILVTSSSFPSGSGIVGHSAIVINGKEIVEATGSGVVIAANNWNTAPHYKGDPAGSKEFVAVIVVGTSKEQDEKVAKWCVKQAKYTTDENGKEVPETPYNYNFMNMSTRDRFYCSHLIWAGFKDIYNIDLNTSDYTKKMIGPYEFVPEDRLPNGQSAWKTEMIYAQNWWGK